MYVCVYIYIYTYIYIYIYIHTYIHTYTHIYSGCPVRFGRFGITLVLLCFPLSVLPFYPTNRFSSSVFRFAGRAKIMQPADCKHRLDKYRTTVMLQPLYRHVPVVCWTEIRGLSNVAGNYQHLREHFYQPRIFRFAGHDESRATRCRGRRWCRRARPAARPRSIQTSYVYIYIYIYTYIHIHTHTYTYNFTTHLYWQLKQHQICLPKHKQHIRPDTFKFGKTAVDPQAENPDFRGHGHFSYYVRPFKPNSFV